MSNSLSIYIRASASLSGNLPEQFNPEWLPGSHIASATGRFGVISVEQISVHGVGLYFILAELQQEVTIEISYTASFFFIIVQLGGSYEMVPGNEPYIFNRQNCYSLAYLARASTLVKLTRQAKYRSFVIAYPVSFIFSLVNFYPFFADWVEKIERKTDKITKEYLLPAVLSEKIYSLLHTPFVPLTEEYYSQVCRDIITEIGKEYADEEPVKVPFNQHDISCIHAAKEYMDAHILEHPTILQLSRKAGINRLKLKKGFKAIYGIGLYGYQLQQRLLIAKTALEKTSKPVHQIARQAGYRNTSNFSIAFKRVYGSSPYQYRSLLHQR